MISFLQYSATFCRHLAEESPREIKRLINNHRLMRVFIDVEEKLPMMDDFKVVLWAFLCWKFSIDMQRLIPSTEVSCFCEVCARTWLHVVYATCVNLSAQQC